MNVLSEIFDTVLRGRKIITNDRTTVVSTHLLQLRNISHGYYS